VFSKLLFLDLFLIAVDKHVTVSFFIWGKHVGVSLVPKICDGCAGFGLEAVAFLFLSLF
jgi:hypothetical protein